MLLGLANDQSNRAGQSLGIVNVKHLVGSVRVGVGTKNANDNKLSLGVSVLEHVH